MIEKLESVRENFKELTDKLSNPKVIANQAEFQKLARRRAELEPIVEAYQQFCGMQEKLDGARQMLEAESDPELREMAEMEIAELEPAIEAFSSELKLLLIPKDEDDKKKHHNRNQSRNWR